MESISLSEVRVLVVDDDQATLYLIEKFLTRHGYTSLCMLRDPAQFEPVFGTVAPDVVLLDLRMGAISGFHILSWLRRRVPDHELLPVLVLTADDSEEAECKALNAGATELLVKPFTEAQLLARIRTLVRLRELYAKWRAENADLEGRVRERTREVVQTQMEVIDRLSTAVESRDAVTGQHNGRVGDLAAAIAENLRIEQPKISLLRRAAPLHDIGKIAIPDAILMKPGRLTAGEFEVIKTHTTVGGKILAGSRSAVLQVAETIALTHHENWDGTGYPAGLAGNSIPLEGRIVAVADVFDALVTERPYKGAWPTMDAVREIRRLAGAKFDPAVVEAFVRSLECSAEFATEISASPE